MCSTKSACERIPEESRCTFPFDLIQEVLDVSCNGTLAVCALVSRDILELSRSRLYRSMKISAGIYFYPSRDIATTSSHLLRHIRYLEINFKGRDDSSDCARQDVIQIFQRLASYGHLTAIWFDSSGCSWEPGFLGYLPHFTPLLQLDSLKYIQAPLVSPRLSDESRYPVAMKFLEALFLSKAYLHLHYTFEYHTDLPPLCFPTFLSNEPIVTTLVLDFTNCLDPKDYRKSWKWFTSHVNLSHLRRLKISLDLDNQDFRFWSDLNNSLPESLSEITIADSLGPSGALVSRFPIEKFHSLKSLSFTALLDESEEVIDSYTSNVIEFVQRISRSSRSPLQAITFFIHLRQDEDVFPDLSVEKWNILGELIASFSPTPRTTFFGSSSYVPEWNVERFQNSFLSVLPETCVDANWSRHMFSQDSEDHRRGVRFGWVQ